MQNLPKETFWITNISKKIVSLSDLAIHIQPLISINLLDSKHHSYTKEDLIKSATTGSLYKKGNLIKIRKIPPEGQKNQIQISVDPNSILPTKPRSVIEIQKIVYEELNVSDDQFAKESAEMMQEENNEMPAGRTKK